MSNFNHVDRICQMAAAQRNHRWTTCGSDYQRAVRKRLGWVVQAGIGEMIERTVRQYLAEKYQLANVPITSISINGSMIQSESILSKPGDVDSTVEIDHPFLLGALTEAPQLQLADGTKFNDIGLLSTGLHGVSHHAKYVDGVYSHLTGGYPIYGGFFRRSHLSLAEMLAYAKRLNDCARNELAKGDTRKSIHRFIDVQSLLVTMRAFPGYLNYQSLWGMVDKLIAGGDSERKSVEQIMNQKIAEADKLITDYVAHRPDLAAYYQEAFPTFPWYDDWINCMRIIRNSSRTEADELRVFNLRDWSIDLILAGVAKSALVLHLLSKRYESDEIKTTYMKNAIAFNLRRRAHRS